MRIFVALCVLPLTFRLVSSLHRKTQPYEIYPNKQQIQSSIDDMVRQTNPDSSIEFVKEKCDDDYFLLHIKGKPETEQSSPLLHNEEPLEVVIMCNVHAREIISSQICMSFIKQLFELSKQIDGQLQKNSKFQILPPYTEYKIYPIANSERQKALKEDHCARKSRNGVDINRNFPTQFNIENYSPNEQRYPGKSPMSQPFSKCLNTQIEKKTPDFFLDVHSGQEAFYYQEPRPFNQQEQNEIYIIDKIVKDGGLCPQCRVTTLAKDGQTINGHIFGDLKVRKKVKYSILIEAYEENDLSDTLSMQQRCFLQFNPSTRKKKQVTTRKWANIIAKMVKDILQRQHRLTAPSDQ